jgi:hypothetical protein
MVTIVLAQDCGHMHVTSSTRTLRPDQAMKPPTGLWGAVSHPSPVSDAYPSNVNFTASSRWHT